MIIFSWLLVCKLLSALESLVMAELSSQLLPYHQVLEVKKGNVIMQKKWSSMSNPCHTSSCKITGWVGVGLLVCGKITLLMLLCKILRKSVNSLLVGWSKAKRGFEVEFFGSVCPVFMHDFISFQSMIT